MTDLDEISGVGPAYAEELAENGFDSAEDIAQADPDDVDEVLASADGQEIVNNALDLTGGAPDDDEDEIEVEDDQIAFSPGFSETQENHMISALVDEEIKQRKRNHGSTAEQIMDIIDEFKSGEPYHVTLDDLSYMYTAASQMESMYRAERGLGGNFAGEIREVKNIVQEQREMNWPSSDE